MDDCDGGETYSRFRVSSTSSGEGVACGIESASTQEAEKSAAKRQVIVVRRSIMRVVSWYRRLDAN